MWLIIASVLSCYTIEKRKDKDDREIEIDHDFVDNGFVRYVSIVVVCQANRLPGIVGTSKI